MAEVNTKYSFADFTGQSLAAMPAKEFSDTQIIGSCFSQERLNVQVFPAETRGVEFVQCNLDNVALPPDSKLTECCNRRWHVQTDGQDWLVDSHGQPTEPLHPELHKELGLSLDPKDLPADKIEEVEIEKGVWDKIPDSAWTASTKSLDKRSPAYWFREKPRIIKTEQQTDKVDGKKLNRTYYRVRGKVWLHVGEVA